MDNVLVANVTNTTFVTGATGFISYGVGWFDNARLDTICDGGTQCVGATEGVVCSMSCSQGYYAYSGTGTRTCQSTGNWTGGDLICALSPPVFYNQSLSVTEVRPSLAFAVLTRP